jgi:hypothetical protein
LAVEHDKALVIRDSSIVQTSFLLRFSHEASDLLLAKAVLWADQGSSNLAIVDGIASRVHNYGWKVSFCESRGEIMAWNGGNLILTKMILVVLVIFLVRILMMMAVTMVVVANSVLDEYSSCHVSFIAVMLCCRIPTNLRIWIPIFYSKAELHTSYHNQSITSWFARLAQHLGTHAQTRNALWNTFIFEPNGNKSILDRRVFYIKFSSFRLFEI